VECSLDVSVMRDDGNGFSIFIRAVAEPRVRFPGYVPVSEVGLALTHGQPSRAVGLDSIAGEHFQLLGHCPGLQIERAPG
jgi:hypothetical protein